MLARLLLVCSILGVSDLAWAARDCSANLTKEELAGALFLHQRNPQLFRTLMVARGAKAATAAVTETRPEYMIALWLRAASDDREGAKAFAYKAALTKKIADGFFDLQDRIDRAEGRLQSAHAARDREDLEKHTLADQRDSLASWVEYLASDFSSDIEAWKKYWILSNVIKLGPWNKAKNKFNERSRGSGALFPELDREALGRVASQIGPKTKTANFAKLYGNELARSAEALHDRSALRGHWRKFKKGSDPRELVDTIDAMGTGWCTAGLSVCRSQLGKGDFWIYYSVDDKGVERIPRVAIRLEDDSVEEVRGVGPQQEIDEAMAQSEILVEKLREFGREGARYLENVRDMKRMTALTKRIDRGDEISRDDLRFLYEIDRPIQSFGFTKDPRVEAYRKHRDHRVDLENIFAGVYTSAQISTTEAEALRGGVAFHYGNLSVDPLALRAPLPRRVSGDLKFIGPRDLLGPLPELPDRIDGNLLMTFVRAVDQLIIRTSIGGDVQLNALATWRRLELPEVMSGSAFLNSVKTLENVVLPKRMKTLHLTTIEDLAEGRLPETLDNLFLGAKIIRPAVVMPRHIHLAFKAPRIQNVDGVHFGDHVGGDFVASYLESAKDTVFPRYVGGDLKIDGVTELRDMVLPEVVDKRVVMTSLERCVDVTHPRIVNGERQLPKLRSAVNCPNLPFAPP